MHAIIPSYHLWQTIDILRKSRSFLKKTIPLHYDLAVNETKNKTENGGGNIKLTAVDFKLVKIQWDTAHEREYRLKVLTVWTERNGVCTKMTAGWCSSSTVLSKLRSCPPSLYLDVIFFLLSLKKKAWSQVRSWASLPKRRFITRLGMLRKLPRTGTGKNAYKRTILIESWPRVYSRVMLNKTEGKES